MVTESLVDLPFWRASSENGMGTMRDMVDVPFSRSLIEPGIRTMWDMVDLPKCVRYAQIGMSTRSVGAGVPGVGWARRWMGPALDGPGLGMGPGLG